MKLNENIKIIKNIIETSNRLNEIWSLVYDVIGEVTDLYSTDEPRCR